MDSFEAFPFRILVYYKTVLRWTSHRILIASSGASRSGCCDFDSLSRLSFDWCCEPFRSGYLSDFLCLLWRWWGCFCLCFLFGLFWYCFCFVDVGRARRRAWFWLPPTPVGTFELFAKNMINLSNSSSFCAVNSIDLSIKAYAIAIVVQNRPTLGFILLFIRNLTFHVMRYWPLSHLTNEFYAALISPASFTPCL